MPKVVTALGSRTCVELGRHLEEVTAPSTLLVPLGATEQHGPHLPLATDSILASDWADAVAARLPGAVVAPVLAYGSSGEHQDFPGTLSIGSEVLSLLIVELVRSARFSFDRVALLAGHAGNLAPLSQAVDQLRHEGHVVVGFVPAWPDRSDIDAHAGRTETSLMLHLHPELVAMEYATEGNTAALSDIFDTLRSRGVKAASANGVLGDPLAADASYGRSLFADLVNRTVSSLNAGS